MEDRATLSLVFGCFDGHGTHGHYISQVAILYFISNDYEFINMLCI